MRPFFAQALRVWGIQPNGSQSVAAALGTGNAFGTTSHGFGGDIQDGTELAIATTDGDTLIALHTISPADWAEA
jgi:LDH2 family malate/lactate/ureidoglycolate dehydrogenase